MGGAGVGPGGKAVRKDCSLVKARPDRSVARVFLLFPDPWPKSRHAERRFVGPANLESLARIMTAGAELRVATDDPTYLAWTLEHLPAHPDFRWHAGAEAARHHRPADWPATRYEQKALREGRPPGTTTLLLDAVQGLVLPPGGAQLWAGAESLAVRDVRRHLSLVRPGSVTSHSPARRENRAVRTIPCAASAATGSASSSSRTKPGSPSNIVPLVMPVQLRLNVHGAQPRPDGTRPASSVLTAAQTTSAGRFLRESSRTGLP